MTIYGTFYNGVSGVSLMGENMGLLADNIANANTIGFKSSRATFEELLSQAVEPARRGNGAALADISTDFNLGKFEPTKVPTDMAIDGKGFFLVSDGATTYYTRNGQFRLRGQQGSTETLELVTPAGMAVLGYGLAADGSLAAATGGLTMTRTSPAKATESVRLVVNLDSRTVTDDVPLYQSWDGSRRTAAGVPDPISATAYDYAATVNVYDTDGIARTLTAYFDSTGDPNVKEFLLACDPDKDRRQIPGASNRYNDPGAAPAKGAGALLYGTLHFNSHGDLVDIRAYTVPSDGDPDPASDTNRLILGRGEAYYRFSYNFTGVDTDRTATLDLGTQPVRQQVRAPGLALRSRPGESEQYVTSTSTWSELYDQAGRQPAAGDVFTFTGSRGDGTPVTVRYTINPASQVSDLLENLETAFDCTATVEEGRLILTDTTVGDSQLAVTAVTYQDVAGNDPTGNPGLAQLFGSEGSPFETSQQDRFQIAASATTSYAAGSHTLLALQDGYGPGHLEAVSVDKDGYLYGHYSNGQQVVQGQVALASVPNMNGLERVGATLFLYHQEAGAAVIGRPNSGGLGLITGGALEGANVDLSRQFAELIATQRVFQANAKSIQTADAIYEELVRLARA